MQGHGEELAKPAQVAAPTDFITGIGGGCDQRQMIHVIVEEKESQQDICISSQKQEYYSSIGMEEDDDDGDDEDDENELVDVNDVAIPSLRLN